uniref:Uncharacterized protein n=1 Tax=Tanacetum cinerariifolium TaxID=118510 RepID=A0A6L2KDI6_TANCI|nr:hypothetical protein [Tanacetum cinerariifolium]
MDACATLTKRVEHLELDKVSQALEITKLKKRVKKLKRRNKVRVLKLRRLQRVETSDETIMDNASNQGRMIAEIDQDDDVVLEDDKEVIDAVKDVVETAQDLERTAESKAKICKIDLDHANKVLSMQEGNLASETVTAASAIITTAEAQVPAATTVVTLTTAPTRDEVINHVKIKAKEDPVMKKYQALKRKPQTKAQARKNMMLYLKNVAGFKMDYFKGMSYDDICPIFEAKFNLNMDFLLKTKE